MYKYKYKEIACSPSPGAYTDVTDTDVTDTDVTDTDVTDTDVTDTDVMDRGLIPLVVRERPSFHAIGRTSIQQFASPRPPLSRKYEGLWVPCRAVNTPRCNLYDPLIGLRPLSTLFSTFSTCGLPVADSSGGRDLSVVYTELT